MTAVSGLAARRGDTAFAFIALRFEAPATRAQVARVLDHLAPLLAEADAALDEIDAPVRLVAVPWVPAETGAALALQRRLLEGADVLGVEAAWCFQAGTSLPPIGSASGDDDEVAWSNGPPPQVRDVRFAVDGAAGAIAEHDGGDLGLALKLAGPPTPGEDAVLLAFHALWLAPYGGRYRDASVTFDRVHRAAHLWAARFAPPCWPEQLVHHLLWIAARIDEVVPIVHGRITPAAAVRDTGDGAEPFVLAGNPLVAMYDAGGEAAVDAWLAAQRDWSPEEQAHMLRELALQLAAEPSEEDPAEVAARLDDEDEGDDDDDDDLDDDDDDVDPGEPGEHADDDDDDDDDDEPEGNADEDRGRQVTRQAGELLRLRAAASRLDPRAAEALIPVLGERGADDARRGAVVDVLGALGDPAAVPALAQVRAGGNGALADRAARALLAIADDTSVN